MLRIVGTKLLAGDQRGGSGGESSAEERVDPVRAVRYAGARQGRDPAGVSSDRVGPTVVRIESTSRRLARSNLHVIRVEWRQCR